jgi:hypothetical protein
MSGAVQAIRPELMDAVLGEIMESMVFAGVERVASSEAALPAAPCLWARVDLIAPAIGEFWMVVGRDAALELSDAVWGGEVEVNEEVAGALVAEIVNAVAGQVLAMLDTQARVELGLPVIGAGELAPTEFEEALHAYVLDDGTELAVVIRAAV